MKYTIGLDVGGTKINGALFAGTKMLKELTIATPGNFSDFNKNLIKLVDFLSAEQTPLGIGVGIAGLVDAKNGIVKYSPNIPFIKNLNLVKVFKSNGFKNVKIDNDANCFARAEMLSGSGKSFKNFLALTLGTGIGGGIIINRQLYRGMHNSGAEFGHVVMNDGFLEKDFQKYRNKRDFKKVGHLLGKSFVSLINIFEPEALILGGSVSTNEHPKFLPTAKLEIKKYLFDKSANPKIIISKLKNAGTLGAALLLKK
jgi:glucokinase